MWHDPEREAFIPSTPTWIPWKEVALGVILFVIVLALFI